ncbi:MAG: flagellar hook capping FlgD N-terminal domain-containing protein [Acidobacteriaceae bacterium]|nr:flagellar hook capping FlgD N-terminal domain-containing protein [Acidobacteriaceae bacterium]
MTGIQMFGSSAPATWNDAMGTTATKQVGTMASSSSSGSTDLSTDITGADFLTLLVSELKNQDPTQPTDPETYVQQMVGVNSLEQLIDINEKL